ncbi:MAG: PLxRFG domain-containing protein [Pseudomonadales bacterium]|nr:PLxRFG domain-containing protein [Pseudomonadales bacterium]
MSNKFDTNFNGASANSYFPLARFGDYWATSFDADENVVEMSMFETQGEQKEWVAEQESKGLDVKRGFKTTKGDMIRSVDSEFVMNVELMVDKSENKDELKDNIYQFYLQTLPDLSMRKSFIHRKQTKGFARDALRAFSHQMFHGSYQLARMKYTPQMEVALKSAEAQVQEAEDPNRAAQIFNELQLRHDWAMNPKGAQWANNVSSFGFTMFLGLSPAAALVNTTQTPLVALPVLGAQFGWDKSSKELLKAAKDYFAGGFNIENSLSGKELKAYQHFIEVGLIDKTLAHDLAGIAEEGGEHSDTRHRVMKVVSFMFHEAEKFNREVTSIAAFRLARQSGHKPEESQNIAEELTWKSHFDYSSGNKARFMQDDKAKVIFMFKQFSLNMSYLLFRNAHQSFKGESKEVRSEALKTITGVLGMHFLFAGALGMPVLLPMVFAIANFIHDDEDEPWDAEVEFRKFLAEYLGNTGGRIIANGLANEVTGIDFASRVSLDGLWVRSSPNDLDGREITTYWGGQLLGPMAGAAGNVAAGLDMVSDGNLQRGIEMMMPVGLKNAMKAVRYNSEGVNSYRGDPVINDVDTSEVFWQAMGFAPSRVGEQYDKNRYIKNKEQRILDRKKLLLNKLSLSINQSDDEFKAEVMESIKKFNSKNPRSAITFDSITRSLKMRKLYSAKSINGINLSNKMRYLAKEVDY